MYFSTAAKDDPSKDFYTVNGTTVKRPKPCKLYDNDSSIVVRNNMKIVISHTKLTGN
jgi:hypothetical protein